MIVSENLTSISVLETQVKEAGMESIVFHNSIVAISHLLLYQPSFFIIDSTAFSFISVQAFVARYLMYDSSLSSLIVLNMNQDISAELSPDNIISSVDELSSLLLKLTRKKNHLSFSDDMLRSSTPPTFFFTHSSYSDVSAPDTAVYMLRLRVTLMCRRFPDVIAQLDSLFFCLNVISDYDVFYSTCEHLNDLYHEMVEGFGIESSQYNEPLNISLFQDIIQALTGYKKLFYTLCEDISSAIIKKSGPVGTLLDYIYDNPDSNLSLDSLSKITHFNKAYLSFLFRQETGQSLSDYISYVRIHHLCALLECGNLPLESLSGKVGFSDSKYLAKVFKAAVGMSPRQYRAAFNSFSSADLK